MFLSLSQTTASTMAYPCNPVGFFSYITISSIRINSKEHNDDLPVLKLITKSSKNTVSEMLLNTIHRVLKSSLKKDIATGRMIRLAINNISMNKSQ